MQVQVQVQQELAGLVHLGGICNEIHLLSSVAIHTYIQIEVHIVENVNLFAKWVFLVVCSVTRKNLYGTRNVFCCAGANLRKDLVVLQKNQAS